MKYILSLLIVSGAFNMTAQTNKGSFMIAGSFSYSYMKSEYETFGFQGGTGSIDVIEFEYEVNSFSLNPKIGYFPADRFAVGISLPISLTNTTSTASASGIEGYNNNRAVGLGPFVRYYIPVSEKLFVLTEGSYSLLFNRFEYNSFVIDGSFTQEVISKEKSKGTEFQIGAGLAYFLNPNIGLELLAFYRHNSRPTDEFNNKTLSLGVAVGFQIYLAR